MKKSLLWVMLMLAGLAGMAQQKEEAEKLVAEGVAYYDKGDFEGALKRYDQALEMDKDNFLAMAEKAMTLHVLKRDQEAVELCRKILELHPDAEGLETVYVTYGNSLDDLNKTDDALAAFDEGIKKFPASFMIWFNKGVTLAQVRKSEDALLCFEKSVTLNPRHPGSHNAIARLNRGLGRRIPALMAYCRFMVLEPQSDRAKENLSSIQSLMGANVEKTGKKSVTISVDAGSLGDTTADGTPNPNNFHIVDMILSMQAALDFEKKNKNNTEAEQFIRKLESVCSALSERNNNSGFYWDFYAPYFVEVNRKGYVTTMGYIIYAGSGSADVVKWLNSHEKEIDAFYGWSSGYTWPAY